MNPTASGRHLSARTFGEAQTRPRLRLRRAEQCESFGSAFLKSRASDSFTAQLKDFIKPSPVNITNCGTVIIRKETDPDEEPNTTSSATRRASTRDPATDEHIHADGRRRKTFNSVLFGTGYTVTETTSRPDGTSTTSIATASTGVTPTINGAKVTFDIDNAADVLDCTYTNRARGSIIVEKITDDGTGSFDFTSGTLTPAAVHADHYGSGSGRQGLRNLQRSRSRHLRVAETVPAGWNLVSRPVTMEATQRLSASQAARR